MSTTKPPLSLTIISGYLGSGKTTLINHLLRNAQGKRLMVLVNDFGELPIDADLISSRKGDTINLSNGCACCSMGGDLFNALVNVLDADERPDHLLIEASGVADPVRIANIASAEPDLKLDAIISLLDALIIDRFSQDPLIGEIFRHQLSSADIILLNKLDLVANSLHQNLMKKINEISPAAQIVPTRFAKIPVDLAIGIKSAEKTYPQAGSSDASHHDVYDKWAASSANEQNRQRFEDQLAVASKSALRIKGVVHFENDHQAYIVQCVGTRCTITASKHLVTTQNTNSRLVAIGLHKKLDTAILNNLFA